jgi:hypothetical protein
MRRLLFAVAFVVTMFAAPTSYAFPASAVSRASTQAAPLYQASFKTKGIKGWKRLPLGSAAGSYWHIVRRGTLIFDGFPRTTAEIQAPFSVAHLTNFAVQAQIEAIGQPTDAFNGFGIVVRNADQPAAFTPAPTATGVMGGLYSSPGGAELVWYPDEVGGAAATLNPDFNTFRVEAHGNDYSLLINGQLIVSFPINLSRKGSHIGLWALSQRLAVKSFQVFRLSGAGALPAVLPIKALALGPSDVPNGFVLAGRSDYFTVAEVAHLNYLSTDMVSGTGYALGYGATYVAPSAPATGTYYVNSEVDAYNSAGNAHIGWVNDKAANPKFVQATTPQSTNYQSGDASGIGDEAYWWSYDVPEPYYGMAFASTQVMIQFRRGSYVEAVGAGWVQGSLSHDDMLKAVTAWAQVVDGRSH